jgi:hypothetical protein
MTLKVQVLRERDPRVDLARFIPQTDAELLYRDRTGALSLAVSSCTGDAQGGVLRRTVVRYVEESGAWRALDETVFEVDAESFSEVSQTRALDGLNLHQAPIRLPRFLTVGQWHKPLPAVPARVAAATHALVRIEASDGSARTDIGAVGLLAVEGGQRGLQWMGAGVGELCIGPARGAPERWIVAARVGGVSFLRAIDAAALERPRLPLRSTSDMRPRSSVF